MPKNANEENGSNEIAAPYGTKADRTSSRPQILVRPA
jgi:hypothetical protein